MKTPQLDFLRTQLDELDEHLISLMAERFKLTDQIGLYKSKHHLEPVDSARERSQAERVKVLAKEYSLDEKVAVKVLRVIISEVVKRHKAIRAQTR